MNRWFSPASAITVLLLAATAHFLYSLGSCGEAMNAAISRCTSSEGRLFLPNSLSYLLSTNASAGWIIILDILFLGALWGVPVARRPSVKATAIGVAIYAIASFLVAFAVIGFVISP